MRVSRVKRTGDVIISGLQTRACHAQKRFLDSIKKRRSVHLIHWFRQYSALAVVVSSVFVVTGTNITTSRGTSGLVSGYFHEGKGDTGTSHNQFAMAGTGKNNLSFVPLASASSKIDPLQKEEAPVNTTAPTSQDRLLAVAQQSPVLKDPEEDGGVTIYTVQQGDTVSSIALSHKITVNTILWANDMSNVDAIKPGDQIFILPVAGISYTVKSNDTIDDIAKQFKADKDKILAFNSLPANGRLDPGEQIIIPDGKKEEKKPDASANQGINRRQYTNPSDVPTKIALSGGGDGHRFPYGYCTWYVAQKRYVPWGGNAGTWLYNAKANGYKTGRTPTVGAIMVTTESAYYGHVALVEKVSGDTITVSEMNYNAWGKVDRRTISASMRSIKGFIY